jgi:hypothetical protein
MKTTPNPRCYPDPSELIALVNEIVAYWKEIARRKFANTYPDSEPSDFEQRWPKILSNFFLTETVRVAKALTPLSEGRDS